MRVGMTQNVNLALLLLHLMDGPTLRWSRSRESLMLGFEDAE